MRSGYEGDQTSSCTLVPWSFCTGQTTSHVKDKYGLSSKTCEINEILKFTQASYILPEAIFMKPKYPP